MKKIILVIEDRKDEQKKAKNLIHKYGCSPVVAEDLESGTRIFKQLKDNIFGVITDLHYPTSLMHKEEKPNGLAVVALCVESGIRVGVCSNINHHFSEYLKIPIKVFATHQSYPFSSIPFSEDDKDWESILKELLIL